MNTWSKREANETVKHVFQKASLDKEFRQLVLDNPHEAVKQLTGKEVPAEFRIKILESAPSYDLTLLLPDYNDELADDDLERVAGGAIFPGDLCLLEVLINECDVVTVCDCENQGTCSRDSYDGCDRD